MARRGTGAGSEAGTGTGAGTGTWTDPLWSQYAFFYNLLIINSLKNALC